ncbi:MAG: GNAT family N-acetyltransferase [Thermoplasmata archaeon]|nr:GNAT family N-acetyltransferase [Thermoplasmata archaeon]
MTEHWRDVIVEFDESYSEELSYLFETVWPTATDYPEHWRKKRMLTSEQVAEEMGQGVRFFGARDEGRIMGVYKARILKDDCFGEHQTILESHRGSGLGSLMYDQFKDLARREGCRINSVNALVGQDPTVKMIEKHGFHKVGEPFEQSRGMLVQRFEREVD